jgi:UPF0042 nucleotide-binding protein
MTADLPRQRVVVVTGLSGAGKLSVLGALEDLGYETVDNPPLAMLAEMVGRGGPKLAIGVDARTRGFDAALVVETLTALRRAAALRAELVYVTADETTLLRRYTESRRRHPLAPDARVADGIAREQELTGPLREAADLVVDTSELPLAGMRRLIGLHYGEDAADGRLVVMLVSFAYRHGLPREADLVFDSRFLRNPHYDPILRLQTGLDPRVGAFIAADPDFPTFFERVAGLVELLLPRFVQEGKKYATIAIGCTGGRHRSVYVVEELAARLNARQDAARPADGPGGWRLHVTHRELAREESGKAEPARRQASGRQKDVATDDRLGAWPLPAQAQEA